MKHQNLLCCKSESNAIITGSFIPKAFVVTLLLAFSFYFNANAQTPAPTTIAISPACNLTGTLEAHLRAGATGLPTEVVVNVVVAAANASSNLNYVFSNNSSGAVIKTYGPVTYDAVKKQLKQNLTIVPGTTAGGFDLRLNVTNANGTTCGCSKSVSVIN